MDKKEFSAFVMALRTYYPKEQILPNPEAMELWFRELQDIPIDVAEAVLRKWVATNKWSPSIAEIREVAAEICCGKRPDWGEGWEQVLKMIRKHGREYPKRALSEMDEITAQAVRAMGWWNLCNSDSPEYDMQTFRKLFESYADRAMQQRQLALPLQELIDNIKLQRGGNGMYRLGSGDSERV